MKIKLSYILIALLLVAIALPIVNTFMWNNRRDTSTITCLFPSGSLLFKSNQDCADKMIEEILQAKHFILIQRNPEFSKTVMEALVQAKNKGVSVKIISDKNLKDYPFIAFEETKLWIDTKPDNYEEISNLSGRQYEDIYIVSWTSSSDK